MRVLKFLRGAGRRPRLSVALGLLGLLSCSPSFATFIKYEASQVGGSTWRYDYTVENDSLAAPIEEFAIFFGLGQYANLTGLGTPAGWEGYVAQPDPLLPDDGFIDVFSLAGGVAPGQSLGAFWIEFDWLLAGTPGSQVFNIIDPVTFTTIDAGFTTPASSAVPVPEPGTLGLLGGGLLACFALRRRARPEARAHA